MYETLSIKKYTNERKIIKTFQPHNENKLIFILCLQDGRLATTGEDKTMKIYDVKNDYKLDLTIRELADTVISITQLKDGKVITTSQNKINQIWIIEKDKYQCVSTFTSDDVILRIVQINEKRIVTLLDVVKGVKIWRLNDPIESIYGLDTNSIVHSVIKLKSKNYLVTTSEDTRLMIWNLDTFKIEYSKKDIDCVRKAGLMELDKDKIIIGGQHKIYVFNHTKLRFYYTIDIGNRGPGVASILLSNGLFLFGSENIYNVYDTENNKYEYIYSNSVHFNTVTKINENTFAAGDETVLDIIQY